MSTEPRLSIVLPCYNEAANLPILLAGYGEVWQDLPAELILVDNGSTDGTAAFLAGELGRPDRAFARSVRVEKNRGYGHGIFTGLQAARGTYVGYSHADMQCAPADLFRAYDRLIGQPAPERTLVKGRREGRELGARIWTGGMGIFASAVLGQRLWDINAQPKVFHRDLLTHMRAPPDGLEFDLYVLYMARQAGLDVVEIPVRFEKRLHGASSWSGSLKGRYRHVSAVARYAVRLRQQRSARD